MQLTISICFILFAFAWHWLGPIYGFFDLAVVLDIVWGEFNVPFAWPITLLVTVAAGLRRAPMKFWVNHLNGCPNAIVIMILTSVLLPMPDELISRLSLLALIFLIASYADFNKIIPIMAASMLGLMLVSYAFTILKMSVFMRGSEFDVLLSEVDYFLGLENLRAYLITGAHKSNALLFYADSSYQMIFPIILMFSLTSYIQGQNEYKKFAMALFVIYALGAVLYIFVPAWGPFMLSDFKDLTPEWADADWRTSVVQKFIVSNSMKIKLGDYAFNSIPAYGFVAAMPSLHVATPAVAFLLNRKSGGIVGLISLFLLIISGWAAIVTGMHYGIDLVVGFLLAVFSVRLVENVCDLKEASLEKLEPSDART